MKNYGLILCGMTLAAVALPPALLRAQDVEAAAEAVVEAARADADAAVAAAEAQVANATMSCAGRAPIWVAEEAAQSDLHNRAEPWQISLKSSQPQGRAFRLSEAATVRLETLTQNGGDSVLHLYDAAGESIALNDDSNGSYNSQIVTDLEPGDYCIVAEDLRNAMDLTLLVGLESHPSLLVSQELACGPETAAHSIQGSDLAATLQKSAYSFQAPALENAYVKFNIVEPQPFTLQARAGGGIDPMMTLFDENGYEIAANNDADGVNARLDFPEGLPSGAYCIGIRAASPSEGQISFSAEQLDVAQYTKAAYERGELAPVDGSYPTRPLKFNTTNGEVILQGAKVNWLSFELNEPSIVALRTLGTPSGADTMLSLFDESGEMLIQVDDVENSRNAAIAPMRLQEGRYFVALSDRASASQLGAPLRPVVVLAERYVKAKSE